MKINKDLTDRLQEQEKESQKKNAELVELRTSHKNVKLEVEKQAKLNTDA